MNREQTEMTGYTCQLFHDINSGDNEIFSIFGNLDRHLNRVLSEYKTGMLPQSLSNHCVVFEK
jgi:hypothetical protein